MEATNELLRVDVEGATGCDTGRVWAERSLSGEVCGDGWREVSDVGQMRKRKARYI